MAGRGFLNALPFNKRDLKKRDLAIIIQLLVPLSKNNKNGLTFSYKNTDLIIIFARIKNKFENKESLY